MKKTNKQTNKTDIPEFFALKYCKEPSETLSSYKCTHWLS